MELYILRSTSLLPALPRKVEGAPPASWSRHLRDKLKRVEKYSPDLDVDGRETLLTEIESTKIAFISQQRGCPCFFAPCC